MQFLAIMVLMGGCSKKRAASSEATAEIRMKKEKVKAKVSKKPLRPLRSVGEAKETGRVTKEKLRDLGDEPSLSRSKVIGSSDQDSEKERLPSPFSSKEKSVKRAKQRDIEVERTPPSSSTTPLQEERTQTPYEPVKVESASHSHSLGVDTPLSSTTDNYTSPNTPTQSATRSEIDVVLPLEQPRSGKEDSAAVTN
ncbi:unnamed protein product [Cylicostephanus goldi]|uniref:Uncharacterized protein n=1 Tax=Cylicostephanus goldi TaxID=71465 RepID=A0A3P7MGG4_CYLGO|nr:unnamed protein product [Cylicostephanus goldi]